MRLEIISKIPSGLHLKQKENLFLGSDYLVVKISDLTCSYLPYACEQTSDYWKNHQSEWAINSVPMKLGLVHYYKVNDILDLLNRPDNGDASVMLAKALIPAKFNIAKSSELEPIILTINLAMNLIGKHRVPYDVPVSFSSATGIQMLSLASTLNSYNLGTLNMTGCSGILPSITRASSKGNMDISPSNLLSVFPNPSHSTATISFSLAKSGKVWLRIYDVNGKLINTIADKMFGEGIQEIKWNTANVSAGTYLIKIGTAGSAQTRKLVVVK